MWVITFGFLEALNGSIMVLKFHCPPCEVFVLDRTPQMRKKPSDWSKEVKKIDKIVDLSLKLHNGSVYDKQWAFELLINAAAMAGDDVLFRKALKGCKKLAEDTNMIDIKLRYDSISNSLG